MADRTSAELFGMFFEFLAEDPKNVRNVAFAEELWDKQGGYDFDHYQMYCDDALIALGFAKMGIHPDYEDDEDAEEQVLYWPYEY